MSQSLIQHSNIPVYIVPRKYVDYQSVVGMPLLFKHEG